MRGDLDGPEQLSFGMGIKDGPAVGQQGFQHHRGHGIQFEFGRVWNAPHGRGIGQ